MIAHLGYRAIMLPAVHVLSVSWQGGGGSVDTMVYSASGGGSMGCEG
jgi:hypothetical protein